MDDTTIRLDRRFMTVAPSGYNYWVDFLHQGVPGSVWEGSRSSAPPNADRRHQCPYPRNCAMPIHAPWLVSCPCASSANGVHVGTRPGDPGSSKMLSPAEERPAGMGGSGTPAQPVPPRPRPLLSSGVPQRVSAAVAPWWVPAAGDLSRNRSPAPRAGVDSKVVDVISGGRRPRGHCRHRCGRPPPRGTCAGCCFPHRGRRRRTPRRRKGWCGVPVTGRMWRPAAARRWTANPSTAAADSRRTSAGPTRLRR